MQQVVGIEIQDKIDSSIGSKLKQFAKDALSADASVVKLQESLNKVDSGKINELSNAAIRMRNAFKELNVATSQMSKNFTSLAQAQNISAKTAAQTAVAEQKLAQEMAKTGEIANKESLAQQKLATERARTAAVAEASANKSAMAEQKLAQAQGATAVASQKLATESARTSAVMTASANAAAISQQKLATAQNQTAISQQRIQQNNAKLAVTQQNLKTAVNQTAISQQRLSESTFRVLTAQERLAVVQAQVVVQQQRAATETVRTEVAQQRLTVAQNQAAASVNTLALSNVRLLTSQQQLTTAQNNSILVMQKTATEAERTAIARARANNETARGATVAVQTSIAEQRLANAQQQAATAAIRHERATLALEQAQKRSLTTVRSLSYVVRDYLRIMMLVSAVYFPVKSALSFADAYVQLNNKLQIVSTSQEHANQLMDELGQISKRTRGNIESTATAFARFDRALQPYGTSQKEVLEMTETINKAMIVSGATAQESASALLQLSQAFNAGKLQGDEFRAVSENLPIAMKYIAQALNSPISKLQDLRTAGKITSEVMLKAFKLMKDEVDATFLKTVPTVGQAMTYFKTSATIMAGEFERATGTLASISKSIMFLSDNMITVMSLMAGGATMLAVALSGPLVAALKIATMWSLKFATSLLLNPLVLFMGGVVALGAAYVAMSERVKMSTDSIATWGDFARTAANDATTAWGDFFRSFADGSQQTESLAGQMFANWGNAIGDFLSDKLTSLKDFYAEVEMTPASIAMAVAKTMDATTTFVMTTIDIVVESFKRVGEDVMTAAAAFGRALWTLFEMFINGIINTINTVLIPIDFLIAKLSSIGGTEVSFGMAQIPNVSFESMKPDMPQVDERKGLGDTWDEKYANRYNTVMQDYVKNTMEAAEATAKLRGEQEKVDYLRKEGENLNKASGAVGRTNKQAQSLAKVVAELDNEIARMYMLKPLREEQERFDKIKEKMVGKGLKLTEAEVATIKEKIATLEQAKKVQAEMDRIYDNSVAPMEKYNATIEATNRLLQEQVITTQQAAIEISKAQQEMFKNMPSQEQQGVDILKGMGIDVGDSDMGIAARLQQYEFFYAEVQRLRDADVISEEAANHAKADLEMKTLQARSAQYKNFFDGLAQLQNSNIRALANIGKAAAITQAVINTYEGATKALAQGGIYGAAMAAVVVAQGLSQVAQIRSTQVGFKTGGYTGNIGKDNVAGVVHGNEFVMDADATSRLGVGNLEALRSGAIGLNENATNRAESTTVVNNNTYNKTEGEQKETKLSIVNVLDPSLFNDYVNTPEGEQVIVNVMHRNQQALQG